MAHTEIHVGVWKCNVILHFSNANWTDVRNFRYWTLKENFSVVNGFEYTAER